MRLSTRYIFILLYHAIFIILDNVFAAYIVTTKDESNWISLSIYHDIIISLLLLKMLYSTICKRLRNDNNNIDNELRIIINSSTCTIFLLYLFWVMYIMMSGIFVYVMINNNIIGGTLFIAAYVTISNIIFLIYALYNVQLYCAHYVPLGNQEDVENNLGNILGMNYESFQPIKKNLKNVKFKSCKNEYNQSQCAVCIEDFLPDNEVNVQKCGHILHAKCLDTVINNKFKKCILCQGTVS